jgi:predicted nucleotidyltransferase component of viral defense system
MLNNTLHKTILISVLKAIYDDPDLRTLLGFKGGTAAYLFYGLPRFSVDLDFDLLDEGKKQLVFEKINGISQGIGEVTEAVEKLYTLFFLVNYQKGTRNLKIEISKRPTYAEFEVKQYLGIPILVVKREDMIAGKLAALLTRRQFASRDMFDLHFFLSNHWSIREQTLLTHTKMGVKEAINKAIHVVESISTTELLRGLGELVEENRKNWVKERLKEDLLFQLRLYEETH